MKRLFALMVLSSSVWASPQSELSDRLAVHSGFSATFSQHVYSPEGNIIMQGEGKVNVLRPNQFRWEVTAPDENLLVSDGQTVWYYTPFVEQVTLYNADAMTDQTPFVLLTRNKPQDWQSYLVTQDGDRFSLKSKRTDGPQGTYTIIIDKTGKVSEFDVVEQDGQKSEFQFSNVNPNTPKASLFTFSVPEGVDVDDQR